MSTPPTKILVPAEDLRTFSAALLEKGGLSAEHARTTADVFVWAALRGVDSHGIARVPAYLDLLEKGVANADARITVESTTPAAAVLDADRAPGPVALSAAADEAVTRARTTGIAAVGVRRTVHTGAIGYYVSKIAEQGLVGIGFVAGMPNMGYTGVRGAAVATSPLAIAVPTDSSSAHAPLLLDMATATIALGKIRQAKASGTPLPEGAAATEDGTPTTDPEKAVMPLPLGGAKGSGMSLAFELLTSVLVGAPIFASFHSDDPVTASTARTPCSSPSTRPPSGARTPSPSPWTPRWTRSRVCPPRTARRACSTRASAVPPWRSAAGRRASRWRPRCGAT